MRPHPTRILMMRAAFEELQDFEGDVREDLRWQPQRLQGVQFGDFLLQMLHARGRWLGFEPFEPGVCRLRAHHKERVQGGTDWGSESGGHPIIDILNKAAEGCLDNPVKFWARGQLKAQSPQAGIGAFPQLFVGGSVGGTMGSEPRLQLLLLLAGGNAAARVLPNQGRVHIPSAGMARILGRLIPPERQLMRNQGTDDGWDLGEFLGAISPLL